MRSLYLRNLRLCSPLVRSIARPAHNGPFFLMLFRNSKNCWHKNSVKYVLKNQVVIQWCAIENHQDLVYVANSHFSKHPDKCQKWYYAVFWFMHKHIWVGAFKWATFHHHSSRGCKTVTSQSWRLKRNLGHQEIYLVIGGSGTPTQEFLFDLQLWQGTVLQPLELWIE